MEKMEINWDRIQHELEQPRNENLQEYIKKLCASGHRMSKIEDSKGFNLLHHAVLKMTPGKVQFIIDLCLRL